MSSLTEILNQIKLLVIKHDKSKDKYLLSADFVSSREKLTWEKIQSKLNNLSYTIPNEVIEFYLWLNDNERVKKASTLFHDFDMGIFPLDEAILLQKEFIETFGSKNVFPLFSQDEVIYWTVVSKEEVKKAVIYSNDGPFFPNSPDAHSLAEFFEKELKRLRRKWNVEE